MNFLLTNDDGITAPGLWAAARALAELGTVLVVAPSGNCSGFGPAYPPTQSLSYFPYRDGSDHPAGVTAYGLNATPAACAHIGLSGIFGGAPIDLVVSGVNEGANMGRDVLYSGTVGAALTAQLLGVPAIAVSLAVEAPEVAHWESAGRAVHDVVGLWLGHRDSAPMVYNVNVPNRRPAHLRGLCMTGLSDHSFLPTYRFELDPDSSTVVAGRRKDGDGSAKPELWTDAWAVAQGYVSVSPLRPFPNLVDADPWSVSAPLTAAPSPLQYELVVR